MAELGETADPRALVPGDPTALGAVRAALGRLGVALLEAGDGFARVDTSEWTGNGADAFRREFDPVPAQWTGTGEALAAAADALADHEGVLAWAQDEAAAAAAEWQRASLAGGAAREAHDRAVGSELARAAAEGRDAEFPEFVDPGTAGRDAAVDRLRRARDEVRRSGDEAESVVGRARDLAPPSPSIAQRLGAFLGDLAAGAAHEVGETGRFLWQIDPARFLVEPAEAARGWSDLGAGLAAAATHPREAVEQAVGVPDARTTPTRWVGGVLAGLGLSALGGAGIAHRVRAAGEVGRISEALDERDPSDERASAPPLGRFNGKTAAEHVADRGSTIGRPSSGKKAWVREVDDPAEVRRVYEELSRGGRSVHDPGFGGERTVLPDGTQIQYRTESTSTQKPVTQLQVPGQKSVKIHLPRGER